MSEYVNSIRKGVSSVMGGLGITLKHLSKAGKWRADTALIDDDNYFNKLNEGLVTIQYPSETIPTPDFSRNRLHNESDDCIACNQCANACPVNCITIESFKAIPDDIEELGTTSDGSKKKLWLSKFDIDMAKCMYCGLCTYPCPTECLTMTPVHDFAEIDRSNFNYHFSVLTIEKEKEKREKLSKFEEEEKARKAAAPKAAPAATGTRVSPLMAKKAATAPPKDESENASKETSSPEATPSTQKKLPPMMAAKLAAKKAAESGSADTSNELPSESPAKELSQNQTTQPLASEKKLPPMMAAKLAAKKAAEEAAKNQSEGGE